MVDVVKLAGLANDGYEQGDLNVEGEPTGLDPAVAVDDSCSSATCQAALKLGLPVDIASTITANGIAAFKHNVPADKAVQFKTEWQVSALAILGDESYDLALPFTSSSKFEALNLLGKSGAEIAKKVDLPVQVEAIRLMRALGIDASQALKVQNEEELRILKFLEKDSMPAKAIDAGAPISRAREFHLQTQVDALDFVRINTALKFVEPAQLESLRRNASLSISVALRATALTINAMDEGMPHDCAWNVTNQHQIAAYKTIEERKFEVGDICAASLAFNASHQLGVLEQTGDLELSLPFHNPYAQLALDAEIDPRTARFVNNEYALAAALNYSVTGSLIANFTAPHQIQALEMKLMPVEEAAEATWLGVRWKMGVRKNIADATENVETMFPYYRETALLLGTTIIACVVCVLGFYGTTILVWLGLKAAKKTVEAGGAVKGLSSVAAQRVGKAIGDTAAVLDEAVQRHRLSSAESELLRAGEAAKTVAQAIQDAQQKALIARTQLTQASSALRERRGIPAPIVYAGGFMPAAQSPSHSPSALPPHLPPASPTHLPPASPTHSHSASPTMPRTWGGSRPFAPYTGTFGPSTPPSPSSLSGGLRSEPLLLIPESAAVGAAAAAAGIFLAGSAVGSAQYSSPSHSSPMQRTSNTSSAPGSPNAALHGVLQGPPLQPYTSAPLPVPHVSPLHLSCVASPAGVAGAPAGVGSAPPSVPSSPNAHHSPPGHGSGSPSFSPSHSGAVTGGAPQIDDGASTAATRPRRGAAYSLDQDLLGP
jgi:hypothetical protein